MVLFLDAFDWWMSYECFECTNKNVSLQTAHFIPVHQGMNNSIKLLKSVDHLKVGRCASLLVTHSGMCNVYNVNNVTKCGSNPVLYVFLQQDRGSIALALNTTYLGQQRLVSCSIRHPFSAGQQTTLFTHPVTIAGSYTASAASISFAGHWVALTLRCNAFSSSLVALIL